jgi:hypothetical protein
MADLKKPQIHLPCPSIGLKKPPIHPPCPTTDPEKTSIHPSHPASGLEKASTNLENAHRGLRGGIGAKNCRRIKKNQHNKQFGTDYEKNLSYHIGMGFVIAKPSSAFHNGRRLCGKAAYPCQTALQNPSIQWHQKRPKTPPQQQPLPLPRRPAFKAL